jgi:hypothetical protein
MQEYSIIIDSNDVIQGMFFREDEPSNAIPISQQIATSIMNAVACQWFKYVNNALENNDEFIAQYTANQNQLKNKTDASTLLQQTDWTTIPDVSDPTKSNPFLANVSDFLTYRNTVRQTAINPPSILVEFPNTPEEVWETV